MRRALATVSLMMAVCLGSWSRVENRQARLQHSAEIIKKHNRTNSSRENLVVATKTDFTEIYRAESEAIHNQKSEAFRLAIAFGIVCGLMAFMTVAYKMTNANGERVLQGGTDTLPVAECTWLCPCTSDGHPLPPDDHPKLRLTDENDEYEDDEKKEETVPLVGGGVVGISLFTLLYGGAKIAWGSVTLLDMIDQDLHGCAEGLALMLGICAVFTAAEGALVLAWATFFSTDIRNGKRVSCPTIMLAYSITMVHLILNSVGTGLSYDRTSNSSCPMHIYAQVFFSTAFVIFFVDLAVIARELGIVSKFETNPYRGLGFWDN